MSWKDAERDQRPADVIGEAAPHQLDRDGTIEDHGPEEPVAEVECWIVGGVAADDSPSNCARASSADVLSVAAVAISGLAAQCLFQRVLAAFIASADRCCRVRVLAVAVPPFRPNSTAALLLPSSV